MKDSGSWILDLGSGIGISSRFKSKMLLAQVADGDNDQRSDTLAQERPPAKYLYKYFQDKIVEREIKYK